jgi:tRNA pseudouridine13 synthase
MQHTPQTQDDGTAPPTPRWLDFDALPYAHGRPTLRATLRQAPADFQVDEQLGFAPDGDGPHWLLRVRKTDANTDWVARRLAATAGVPARDVGYAGLKDRRAITTQWFTLPASQKAGEDPPGPDWSVLMAEGIEVVEAHRHRRKLRRGTLAGNAFRILLRDVDGDGDDLADRIARIVEHGVPNWFGPQRFGRRSGNLHRAAALFRGERPRGSRQQRGLWLSAARAQLFNEVLARRVANGTWDNPQPGERMQLAGSQSHFLVETIDAEIRQRHADRDILPTGPLFGAGEPLTAFSVAAIEAAVAASFPDWIDGLTRAGLHQERRALRLDPSDLTWDQPAPDQLLLQFGLPAGAYATAVLRELVLTVEPAVHERAAMAP